MEVARQIQEQCEEQMGVAEIAVRGEEEELMDIEKDLRVILNVSSPHAPPYDWTDTTMDSSTCKLGRCIS